MAIVGLPIFVDNELLSAARLNSLRDIIEDKFAGGVVPEDMLWPLRANGDIDLDFFEFRNVPKFWKQYNLEERDVASGVTIQDVFDAVESDGGGVVVIPPDSLTTISALDIPSNCVILGSGWSSVLQIAPSPAQDPVIKNKDSANENIWFVNLKIDGSNMSSTATAVSMRNVSGSKFQNVLFEGVRGVSLLLSNNGSAGVPTTDARIEGCRFADSQAANNHFIELSDAENVIITHNTFTGGFGGIVYAELTNNDQILRNIHIEHNEIQTSVDNSQVAIRMIKTGPTTRSVNQRFIYVEHNTITGTSGESSRVGVDLQLLSNVYVNHNTMRDSDQITPAVLLRECEDYQVNSNKISDMDGDGIVVGSEGNGTAAGSRTDLACDVGQIKHNMLRNLGFAGVVINGIEFHCDDNQIYDISQAIDATYAGIELWYANNTRDYNGSMITHNTARNKSAGAPDQLAGLETYTMAGSGVGATDANISVQMTVTSNNLPGMAAGGADFTASATMIFANNIVT